MVNPKLSFISEKSLPSNNNRNNKIHDLYAKSQLVDAFLETNDDALSLRMWLDIDSCFNDGESNKQSLMALLLSAIVAIDKKVSKQLDEILHNKGFKQLEASWRGLEYLIEEENEYDTELKCKVKLLHLTWRELTRDCSKAIDFDQSDFFRVIYNNEFNMPGGEPFGLLIGDYKITHRLHGHQHANDIDTLRKISQTAAASFSPFITSAAPSFFGVDNFSELASVAHIETQFSLPEYIEWQSVRAMEDAKFLGITLPDILLRSPYLPDGSRREKFPYRESISHSEDGYLWGNAAYAFAAVAIRDFCESGWFSHIRGVQAGKYRQGLVVKIPQSHFCVTRRLKKNKLSVNLQVGDRLEKQLSDSGFIPISMIPETDYLAFYSNSSVNNPKVFDSASDTVNAKLASMLQYILCVSRFAHYIKVIGRDKIGAFETAEEIESYIQKWIFNYTSSSSELPDELIAKYPLNEAKVEVKQTRGRSDCFYSIIHLRPHFQLDQMVSNIRLITELSPISN
ncbi:type VI secretion system contractile sheath large subunit [Photobacterium sanguinicancri]|uniref:Type VI secretion system contractile sheath large subunit n=1 Tax=Photobacterium sanguinicancri TaxID=875932 RepID=A0AAW7XYU9_9GAMM|nr:type VI secretion system contractile sheath large subunit [Photobacterium sanguinicancri]KXI21221.1 type VI secretion protein [Photobacterium sanguinicancri]MDO6541493.1 type VI secretion system contractile sheath large subunit [Photobacterium sanguinicancri]